MKQESKVDSLDEEVWYVHLNNEPKGPFMMRDLDVLLRTNELNSRNLAWKQGMKDWKALNEIQEIKNSILESSKEILEIEKKRQILFENTLKENKEEEKKQENAEDEQIENKDENPLTILETAVDNLIQKSFHQSTDGKWNILDEQKGEWIQQDQEPTEQIQKMKQLLLNKLKNQLFFDNKGTKRKKNPKEEKKEPEQELTKEQLLRKQKNRKKTKRQAEKKKEKWYQAKINTFVYISGLPQDITEEELKEFAIKAGVLRIDLNTGKEKIKIYKDQNGFPKGDAAISYAKEQSVEIAVENLNDKEIRSGFKVTVEKAQFSQKEEDYKPREMKKQSLAKKIQAKMMEKKQLSWDDNLEDEGEGLKIVILKKVIDVKKANNDEYLQAMKQQISQEVSQMGEIKRIRFYETHPDGVVEVKFAKQKDAETCVYTMPGKKFDGREIECDYWDGETDYKRDASSLELQKQRLQRFVSEEGGLKGERPLPKIDEKAEEEDEEVINSHLVNGV